MIAYIENKLRAQIVGKLADAAAAEEQGRVAALANGHQPGHFLYERHYQRRTAFHEAIRIVRETRKP